MSAHIIDKQGNIIYSASKIGYTYFSEGLCCVLKEKSTGGYMFGYIDTTGKLVIPYQFDDADFFQSGVARVKKGDKWGFIACGFWCSEPKETHAQARQTAVPHRFHRKANTGVPS